MKKFRAYKMIVNLSDNKKNYVNMFYGVGKNKTDVMKKWEGNGEYEVVQDVTEDTPIYVSDVSNALQEHGFKESEIELIEDLLFSCYDNAK